MDASRVVSILDPDFTNIATAIKLDNVGQQGRILKRSS